MLAWIPQAYPYVPAIVNVRVYVEPVASGAVRDGGRRFALRRPALVLPPNAPAGRGPVLSPFP